jgi:hypothetical protein
LSLLFFLVFIVFFWFSLGFFNVLPKKQKN